ncbi:MAG: carboxymuconolactone decarboxylase family protein [Hyphomicrobiaceae bacterium]|nr:carboxymuconolactone decarboxylase family protein [Hyphomicrobiaceae bacterium]
MAKDYVAIADSVVTGANKLAKAVPDAMGAFGALGKASYGEGKLSAKTKELISLAISVAARCDGCVAYHARAAHKKGVSREEVAEALAVAIQMGGGPSMVYAGQALEAYDTFAGES